MGWTGPQSQHRRLAASTYSQVINTSHPTTGWLVLFDTDPPSPGRPAVPPLRGHGKGEGAGGGEHMTIQTSTRTRSIWQDTRTIVSMARTRTPRPAHTEQPRPVTKSQVPAEKEADRWLAEMIFEHYSG